MVRSIPDYQRLADLSPDAVFRWDFVRGLTFVSPGFERLTGRAAGDVLLRPEFLASLFHATGWADFQSAVARVRDDGSESATIVAQILTDQGKPAWVEVFAIPVRDDRGVVVGVDGSARDVSQHLEVADQLSRRTMEQATLLQVQRELLTQLDLRRTLGKIVDRAQRLLRATTCTVFLLEPDGATLRPLAAAGEYAEQLMVQRPMLGQGLTGWVAENGVPQKVDHTARDPRVALVPETPDIDESLMCAPLELGGRVTGALLLSGQPEQYAEADLDFLVALAQVAALAIANSQTFDQVQRQATINSLTGAFNRAFFSQNLRGGAEPRPTPGLFRRPADGGRRRLETGQRPLWTLGRGRAAQAGRGGLAGGDARDRLGRPLRWGRIRRRVARLCARPARDARGETQEECLRAQHWIVGWAPAGNHRQPGRIGLPGDGGQPGGLD